MRFTSRGYEVPALTVDAVLLRGRDVLLVRRGKEPFAGAWALPGGFVDVGETTEAAALRELAEETGMLGVIVGLVGVYSDPQRDPRGHTVSVTYAMGVRGLLPGLEDARGMDDAAEAGWFPIDDPPAVAFDHARILADARRWLDEGGLARLVDATAC